jgi:hypothetical protein
MFQDHYCHHVLTAALALASDGRAVFPLIYCQKEPATEHGFYDATTNPATIRRWLGGNFRRNLAVRTGLASGCWVLDCDDPNALKSLEETYAPLPVTRRSQSSRGPHLWFTTTGVPIPSSTGRVAPGFCVRGEAGYVVVPPSLHPDGVFYEWVNDAPLVQAPPWLVELARKPPTPEEKPSQASDTPQGLSGPSGTYGAAALRAEIEALADTAPGGRNIRLNRASFCLHQLVAGRELKADQVEKELIEAATKNGLVDDDGMKKCLATIRSGARAGLLLPRSRPKPIVIDGGRT